MNSLIRFEFVAAAFYADTGYLRPGKDEPAATSTNETERQEAWDKWRISNERAIRAFSIAAERLFLEETP